MSLRASDPKGAKKVVFGSLYMMPGETRITIDPSLDEPIQIVPSTGNTVDGSVASALTRVGDIYQQLLMVGSRGDALGLSADSVATVVTGKLDHYVDSVCAGYAGATPEIAGALRNGLRLYALELFLIKYATCKGNPEWDAELSRLKTKIDLAAPENALFYYYPRSMVHIFGLDNVNESMWIVPDEYIGKAADYAVDTLSPKAAEAVIGSILSDDGAGGIYSKSAPGVTERFKSLYPQSAFLPVLEYYAARNIAFNNPVENDNVHFLDNTAVKTLADILSPYKGKPVLIDVWATWCRPCLESFSHVEPLQKYAAENGIQLLYLSIDENVSDDRWKSIVLTNNLIGDHIMINPDVKTEIYDIFGGNGWLSIPVYGVVDSDGNLRILPQPIAEAPDFGPLRAELEKIK
ncbi:MAG: TlpA family protein disulfide reductase [Bacteroides sp.]|nr:TlpA family protein disulfide reductase [Bacteroides sp.]